MTRILAAELPDHIGSRVLLKGWLHHTRGLANVTFLLLRDRSGIAQIALSPAERDALPSEAGAESVLAVTGDVHADERAPRGVEVRSPEIQVISAVSVPPPFELFRPDIGAQRPTILDHAGIALRHPRRRAIFQIQSATVAGYRSAMRGAGFTEIFTPKIVAGATEGGANCFTLDYFGRLAYLAQSPQLYKQMLVGAFERVFEVGPVFRAEPHDTPRHLNEYVSLDAEMGFIDDHRTVMAMLRSAIAGMVRGIADGAADSLALMGNSLPLVPEEIPVVHFSEALEIGIRLTGEGTPAEPDLLPVHETALGNWAQREHESAFLFVTGFPRSKRPFYTHPEPERLQYTNSFDLLFNGLELATGGQRLHRYSDYLQSFKDRGVDPAPFESYLEVFRFGMPPHGGFAIGLERFVARLLGFANLRDTTLFPRDLNRLVP